MFHHFYGFFSGGIAITGDGSHINNMRRRSRTCQYFDSNDAKGNVITEYPSVSKEVDLFHSYAKGKARNPNLTKNGNTNDSVRHS